MILDESKRPLWMMGQKVEAEFLCRTQSFSLSPAEKEGKYRKHIMNSKDERKRYGGDLRKEMGKGRVWKGIVQLC